MYDVHLNAHNVSLQTISIGGVCEVFMFSYIYLKAFVGGEGMKLQIGSFIH